MGKTTVSLIILLLPFCNGDAGAFSDTGNDIEFVDQPFCTAQSHTESASSREAIFKRQFKIWNTRPGVFKSQSQTATGSFIQRFYIYSPTTPVFQGVACQFAGSRDDLCLVYQAET